jgi:hypothetical protein
VNCQSLYLPGVDVGVGFHDLFAFRKVERVAIEVALSTVDQSDIRGSSRIIVIRRELPQTSIAGPAARPAA